MAELLPYLLGAAFVLDFAIANYIPVRLGLWLAYCPLSRRKRFRYRVPETVEESSLPEISARALDRSLETGLRVVRDVRYWPPVVLPMLVLSTTICAVMLQHPPPRPYLLMPLMFLLLPLLGLASARYEAERLTLELLELARPWEGTVPFAVTRDGKLVSIPRLEAAPDGRIGSGFIALLLVPVAAFLGLITLVNFSNLGSARTTKDLAMAVLGLGVFGLLGLAALAGIASHVFHVVTGRRLFRSGGAAVGTRGR